MKKSDFWLIAFIVILLTSCGQNKKPWHKDVSEIEIQPLEIHRYGDALFNIDKKNLKKELKALSSEFGFFLNTNLDDTLKLIQISDYLNDPKIIELYEAVSEKFKNVEKLEKELTNAFRHLKYYYPEMVIPRVYTYISGIDIEQPFIYRDSVLIIGLDLYLGEDFVPYKKFGLPRYITQRMQKDFIPTDCMKAIGITKLPADQSSRTLLDEMILHGKLLYFVDVMLPETPDSFKIGYTAEEMQWCNENENNLWAFLIENDLLYSPDFQVVREFTQDGPFTKGFGNDSPGRLGAWLGWKIVRKFMINNPDETLTSLLQNTDSQDILKRSKYKPKKK